MANGFSVITSRPISGILVHHYIPQPLDPISLRIIKGVISKKRQFSVGRSAPIQTNPTKPNMEIGNNRTTPKDQKDPELERSEKGQPL